MLHDALGGLPQHVLQRGYNPFTAVREPRKPIVQNGFSYASVREAAEAARVVDIAAEWQRIRDEEGPVWPRDYGTSDGFTYYSEIGYPL